MGVYVVAVLLIVTLLQDLGGWVANAMELSCGGVASSSAPGAPARLLTPVGKSGAIIWLPFSGFTSGLSGVEYLG